MKRSVAWLWAWLVGAGWLPAQLAIRYEGVADAGVPFGAPFTIVVEQRLPPGAAAGAFDPAWCAPWLVEQVTVGNQPAVDGGTLRQVRLQVRATGVGAVAPRELCVPWVAADGRAERHCGQLPGLQVQSVLPEPPGPVEWAVMPRLPHRRWWPWFVALAGAAGALGGAWWWRRGRAAHGPAVLAPVAADAAEPPAARALRQLRALALPGAVPVAAQQAFAVVCTDLVREYLAQRFALPADRRTSAELLAAVGIGATDLQVCLEGCDRVKFAALALPVDAQERVRAAAMAFVVATAPPPEGTQ